eukprot:m.239075 g.239075  ORF g.239075 m.239075 type:complete len:198 (-) comp22298_c0_seq1:22-615(-)
MAVKIFAVVVFALVGAFALTHGAAVDPPVWPNEFAVAFNFTFNKTSSEGWLFYDWDLKSQRIDHEVCFGRPELGQCRLLFAGPATGDVWVYFPTSPALYCCALRQLHGLFISPTWLKGASYLGSQIVNGKRSAIWIKQGYVYADDVLSQAPVQLNGTVGTSPITYNYEPWFVAKQNPAIFTIPTQCVKYCPRSLFGF